MSRCVCLKLLLTFVVSTVGYGQDTTQPPKEAAKQPKRNAASASDASTLTVQELFRTIDTIKGGQRISLSGLIRSIPMRDIDAFAESPSCYVYLHGAPHSLPPSTVSCRFQSVKDVEGLAEEQRVVIEGVVYPGSAEGGRRDVELDECRIVRRGEIPEYAPAPFKAPKQRSALPEVPDGVRVDERTKTISIGKDAISEDGSVSDALISALMEQSDFENAIVKGELAMAGLRQIARLKELRRVDFDRLPDLSTLELSAFAEHPRLRVLTISRGKGLNNESLRQLSQLRCLMRFECDGDLFKGTDFSQIDDAGMGHLAKLKSLRWLELPADDERRKPAKITDAGLAKLGALSRLQVLTLSSQSFDGSGFAALENCGNLQVLAGR